jgi:hypothetical protein
MGAVSLAIHDPIKRGVSLRRDESRMIVTCAPAPKVEHYDLATDRESRDPAAERPASRRELEAELWSMLGVDGCTALEAAGESPDAETENLDARTIESLRALGYLDP